MATTPTTVDKKPVAPKLTPNEEAVRLLFAEYVKKSRDIFAKENPDPHYTNSEVSIMTHSVLYEFDKYRSNLKLKTQS